MTDETIPVQEESAAEMRTFTERVSVTGGELVETVQALLREAAVRKITVQDKDGRTLVEIPLYAGIAGALILGYATVLALIAAWFAQVSILIERDHASDRGPSAVGEAMERAVGRATTASSQVVGSVMALLGSASQTASGTVNRLADSLETRLRAQGEAMADAADVIDVQGVEVAAPEPPALTADDARRRVNEALDVARGDIQTDADDALPPDVEDAGELLAAAEPRQCAAITKAGSRCKRPAVVGSEFCSMHQVA